MELLERMRHAMDACYPCDLEIDVWRDAIAEIERLRIDNDRLKAADLENFRMQIRKSIGALVGAPAAAPVVNISIE